MKTRTETKLGRGLSLSINKGGVFGDGFVLWFRGRWIVDASCLTKDNEVRISNELNLSNPDRDYDGTYCYHYKLKRRGKTKGSARPVRRKTARPTGRRTANK